MSQTNKVIVGVAVLAVVAGGAYYWFALHGKTDSMANQEKGSYMNQGPATVTTLPSGSDTSDAALQQDSAAIDAQMKGLDSDSANVDQSVSQQSSVQ